MNHDGASLSGPMRVPPQNLECEAGVLGSVLLGGKLAMDQVVGEVSAVDFYRDANRLIFAAMVEMYDVGREIDGLTLAAHMTKAGTFERVGGADYLRDLIDGTPHAAHAKSYAQVVRQKSIARNLVQAATTILDDAYSNQYTSSELSERAELSVFAASDHSHAHELRTIRDAVDDAFSEMERTENGEVIGVTTGIPTVDEVLGGFRAGQMVILAARPAVGKTAFALTIAEHVARTTPVLFVSLEMAGVELAHRYLSLVSGVAGDRMKRPDTLTYEDQTNLSRAKTASYTSRIVLNDTPGTTATELGATARRAKTWHGIGFIVVDYLQFVDGPRMRGESREQEVSRVSRRLKSLSKELDVPILVLAQLNRQSESRDGNRPRLGDLRESGQIEQDAHAVLLLHRPELYDPNDRAGEADLIIAKNRNGRTGTVRLRFVKHLTKFEELTQEWL